ncbi:MAG: methylenetetrahydrofolate reductase [Trueperaceae bacterium]|nr:methylenetetrahydrofolate reductase [Trueperaceae bacterium]
MRISVELLPRDAASLDAQLDELAALGGPSRVDTVNLPDVLRFEVRSWEAAARVAEEGYRVVPHVRAIDVDPSRPPAFLDALDAAGLDEVLVVAGDAPADLSRPVYATDSVTLIRRLKAARPAWRVYAALDPYRTDFVSERRYLDRKVEAGADGVFTQPFFDVRLAEIWAEWTDDLTVPRFWGATSVTSERSARYWTTRNRAVLPGAFAPTLAHSREVARDLLAFARGRGDGVYFMPIRASVRAYLDGVV